MTYDDRLAHFRRAIEGVVDLVFLPISADLAYLTGVPRELPSFGAVLHPGMLLEGAWLTPAHHPVLTLPHMTAVFGGLSELDADLRVLGDHDDPLSLLRDVLGGFDLPSSPCVAVSDATRAETVTALQTLYPGATFSSATSLLNPQRRVKTEEEIAVMRKAGAITEQAFEAVLGQLRHGMTELDIVTEVDYQLRKYGALGPSFVTSMYNAGPEHELTWGKREERWHRPLYPPVSLLFDFGAVHEGYCYDFGRTVAFGQPSEEFQRVYDLVMAAQRAGIAALQPGTTTAEVDAAARRVIEHGGFGKAFRHRLGHGIGMDVHEAPFLTASDTTPLAEGMLFTVEPSITRSHDFSARVEDVVVVRPGGGEPLTTGYQSLFVID